MKKLENRLRYPQPHNIRIPESDPLIRYQMIIKAHGRLKYEAKNRRAKQSRRIYD